MFFTQIPLNTGRTLPAGNHVSPAILAILLACITFGVFSPALLAQEEWSPVQIPMTEYVFESYPSYQESVAAVEAGVGDNEFEKETGIFHEGNGDLCGYTFDGVFRGDPCVWGNPESSRDMVVFGSSYVHTWLPGFHAIGVEHDWKITQFTKPGCLPIGVELHNSHGVYDECLEFQEWVLSEISRIQPEVIVIDGAWDTFFTMVDGEPTQEIDQKILKEQLSATIETLQETGATVFVFGTIPKGKTGPACMRENMDLPTRCDLPFPENAGRYALNEVSRAATEEAGGTFVDLIPFFCTDTVCPTIVSGIPTHNDSTHVNPKYALWLRDALYELMGLDDQFG